MLPARLFVLTVGLALCPFIVRGQGVKWTIPPEYDSVEHVTEKLFKVTTPAGEGIVTADGEVIVDPADADKITAFSENRAIALRVASESTNAKEVFSEVFGSQSTKKYRLYAIISSDGELIVPPGELFVKDYPFFSEGMLPVYDRTGKYGFVDVFGDLVIACNYLTIHPFCQGFALVEGGIIKKLLYIDKNGVEMHLDKNLGRITFGTSFYNDEALVCSKSGTYCTIGTSGQIIQMGVKANLKFDWKYRLSDEKQPGPFVPSSADGPGTFQANGKYGYINDGRYILSPQLEAAQPFRGEYAIASLKQGATGVLKLLKDVIVCGLDRGTAPVSEKGMECVALTVLLPEEYKNEEITVRCFGEGHDMSYVLPGDGLTKRTSEFIVPSQMHNVEVRSGELLLLVDSFDALGPDANIKVTAYTTQPRADENDNHPFVVVFSNSGKQDVKINVSVTGGNSTFGKTNVKDKSGKEKKGKEYSTTTIVVKAGASTTLNGFFKNVSKEEKRTIKVTYGEETVFRTMTVKPIFSL